MRIKLIHAIRKPPWLKVGVAITSVAVTIALLLTFLPYEASVDNGILSIGIRQAGANPDWLSGWGYRKSHNLTGATGAGTDYQMKVVVHSDDPFTTAKLTLLNERSTKAFTIAAETSYTEYDFGTTIPTDTVVVLCMLRGYTANDLAFKKTEAATRPITQYSMGADAKNFDGSLFALVPVVGKTTWCSNAGASGAVDVYVVGYFVEDTEGDFYFEMFDEDNQAITNGTATNWTSVNISSLQEEDGGLTIKGAYIALDCATDQDVYFRAGGNTSNGVLWETDTNDPGTHLLGMTSVNSSGIFEYKTSAGNAINVYVEGLIHEASASVSDKLRISDDNEESITMVSDSTWNEYTPGFTAKVYGVHMVQSPNSLNYAKTRPKGGTNAQNWMKKDSCGIYMILTAEGTGGAFEYWSDAAGGGSHYVYIGAVSICSIDDTVDYDNEVYLDNKCTNFPTDIAFTDNDGATELYHWCEDLTADPATFWVKVADNLTSNQTIYIYCGKSGGSSNYYSGDDTFQFFDDFPGSSIDTDKWEGDTGATSVSGGIMTHTKSGASVINTISLFSSPVVLRARHQFIDPSGGSASLTFGFRTSDWANRCYGYVDLNNVNRLVSLKSGGGRTDTDTNWIEGSYTLKDIIWDKDTPRVSWFDNGTEKTGSPFETANNIATADQEIFLQTVDSTQYLDWIFVRKYTDPEPTDGGWGEWESFTVEITNTPSTNDFGILQIGTTSNTAIDYFTITNTGNCAVDITIQGTDATGGDDTWTLSDTATPGENIYGLYAGLDDDDDTFDVIVRKTATYNTLVSDLAEDATQDWGLKIYMPTALNGYDNNEMSATITLVASEAS